MVLDHPHHLFGQLSSATQPLCVVVSGGSETFCSFQPWFGRIWWFSVFKLFRRWFGGGARSGGVWFLAVAVSSGCGGAAPAVCCLHNGCDGVTDRY
ncbi:hypothetical protein QL285_043760 [Trifolium repens]|nr:hypothetical protein QL285_043760 [Trifolium repens]